MMDRKRHSISVVIVVSVYFILDVNGFSNQDDAYTRQTSQDSHFPLWSLPHLMRKYYDHGVQQTLKTSPATESRGNPITQHPLIRLQRSQSQESSKRHKNTNTDSELLNSSRRPQNSEANDEGRSEVITHSFPFGLNTHGSFNVDPTPHYYPFVKFNLPVWTTPRNQYFGVSHPGSSSNAQISSHTYEPLRPPNPMKLENHSNHHFVRVDHNAHISGQREPQNPSAIHATSIPSISSWTKYNITTTTLEASNGSFYTKTSPANHSQPALHVFHYSVNIQSKISTHQVIESTIVGSTPNNGSYYPETGITSPTSPREEACTRYKQQFLKFSKNATQNEVGDRIGGGEEADVGDFPYAVALGMVGNNEENVIWLCGGSLVSEDFVLTAAHCITDARVQQNNKRRVIGSGVTRLRPSPLQPEHRLIASVHVHPQWEETAQVVYHDLALLRLQRPIVPGANVRPLCLPRATAPPPSINQRLTAVGWGAPNSRDSFNKGLLRAEFTLLSDAECSSLIEDVENILPKGLNNVTLCVRDPIAHICSGDSGGPLLALGTTGGDDVLWGVVSSSGSTPSTALESPPASCRGGLIAIATLTQAYLPWIESIVWPQKSNDATQRYRRTS